MKQLILALALLLISSTAQAEWQPAKLDTRTENTPATEDQSIAAEWWKEISPELEKNKWTDGPFVTEEGKVEFVNPDNVLTNSYDSIPEEAINYPTVSPDKGVITGTCLTAIDRSDQLISELKEMWRTEVMRNNTTKSFGEWVAEKGGE